MPNSSLVFLVALVVTLLLVTISVRMARSTGEPSPGALSRFFLVALRLAIGWHFFIEATEKLHDPSWSSEGYLRESTGPLAPYFRDLAGDRLVEQMTLTDDGAVSTELDARWQAYVDGIASFYRLNAEQLQSAQAILDQTKADAKTWLSTQPRKVKRITTADDAPPVWDDLTMPERLKTYQKLKDGVTRIEADQLGRYGEDAEENWKTAKMKAARYRAGLQKDLDLLDRKLKRNLTTVLLGIAKQDLPINAEVKSVDGKPVNYKAKLEQALKSAKDKRDKDKNTTPDMEWDQIDAREHKFAEQDLFIYQGIVSELRQAEKYDALDEQTKRIAQNAIDKKKAPATSYDLLPYHVNKPLGAWTLLDWGDFAVKWGLLVVGILLLVGLLTRTACVVGALYLLMFYLAMPALPGWPASPRAEGHYLFINKNIIEMLALFALATLRTGRWAGLDGILGACCGKRTVAVSEETPVGTA